MDVAFAGLAVFGVSRLEPPTEPCQSMLRSSLGTFTRVLAKPDMLYHFLVVMIVIGVLATACGVRQDM